MKTRIGDKYEKMKDKGVCEIQKRVRKILAGDRTEKK